MHAVLFVAAMAAELIGALPLNHDVISDSKNYAKARQVAEERGAPLMVLVDDSRTSKGRKITIPPYEHVVHDEKLIVCRIDVSTKSGVRLAEAFDVRSYPYALIQGVRGDILYRGAGDWVQPRTQHDATSDASRFTKVVAAKPVIRAASVAEVSKRLVDEENESRGELESTESNIDQLAQSNEMFVESSIDLALERAKQANRLLVVFIKSDSCFYCVKMKQESLADEEVQATVASRFVSATIKAEDSRSFVANQGVRMFPTTLVLDSEGGLVDRLEGFVPADQLVSRLERATSTLVSQR